MKKKEEIRGFIRKNYKAVALKGADGGCGCGDGCCGTGPVDIQGTSASLGYDEKDLAQIPGGANMGLGCGNPVAIAGLKEGETVLDLGSGGGMDCFLARSRVGEAGHVIGVDMTPEMLELARKNAEESGFANVEFRLGEIEHLPVADASVDVVISNCVINLALDKAQVFKDAYRVLKAGGRLSVSDVVATAPLPEEVQRSLEMVAGCIGGAAYVEEIRHMLEAAGFVDIRLTPKDNSRQILESWVPGHGVEEYVASFMIEARKEG
ncbi:arsenite methyltransferase [Anaerotalea alkaliphila]|uniref:Arsenite methyltransferase n=1 Tax=Anaerotalea alkaliphila TaxID=2662126 RepID=A0A7X5HVV0_9FIRM|nr:arsenite methyltransferase [Anaerotalea alkaliphila]NDL67569.1 arsenite methyltransferase [Anaerotalea alkaliphila]